MTRVCLGDVANERKENCKTNEYNDHIVGLEHLIPQEVTLTQWAEHIENTFTKVFHKGDILFGRRRAYLKKAAVAPFDGICSGDITVIEAKPNKIVPELLPFIIQNDNLFDYAVEKSAGSLSPRVKWSHLQNYEFELPDLNKQRELAELLWAAEEIRQAYKNLIPMQSQLLKSKFIDFFKDTSTVKKLTEICTPKQWKTITSKDLLKEGYPVYGANGIIGYTDTYNHENPTVLITCRGATCGEINVSQPKSYVNGNAMCLDNLHSSLRYEYVEYFCKNYDFKPIISGSAQPQITIDGLSHVDVLIPDIEKQDEFISFCKKNESLMIELQESLNNLNLITKTLINQTLIKEVSHV